MNDTEELEGLERWALDVCKGLLKARRGEEEPTLYELSDVVGMKLRMRVCDETPPRSLIQIGLIGNVLIALDEHKKRTLVFGLSPLLIEGSENQAVTELHTFYLFEVEEGILHGTFLTINISDMTPRKFSFQDTDKFSITITR